MTEEHARRILGLNEGATDTEIAAAYRRLMQTVHPDVCKGPISHQDSKRKTSSTSRWTAAQFEK